MRFSRGGRVRHHALALEPKASVLRVSAFWAPCVWEFQYVAQSPLDAFDLLRIAFFSCSRRRCSLYCRWWPSDARGNAWTYTFLLASLGLGAIATAFFLPRLRVLITRDRLLRDGTLIQAFAMVSAGFAPNVWAAMPAMMLAGAAWLAVVNTLTVASQLSLPDWVRARGMSLYMMTMMAATSVSAAVWGQVASLIDVPWTFVAAAATGVALWLMAARSRTVPAEQQDRRRREFSRSRCPRFRSSIKWGPSW